jgi:hypothetical protein
MSFCIIVARFNENVEWTKQFTNVIIYNKGNKLDNGYNEVFLNNVGREGHTYYKYICENYEKLPEYTFNTGHVDSVETLLDALDDEYYIIGVDGEEKTHWNKISHVSRHPVNGQMMKVCTKSGRIVETTTSHSHLIRENHIVTPIIGANMKEGMRIPVCSYIDDTFVKDTYKDYKLDELFGWFIGAYLAEGNLNYNEISITNVSEYYIENTKKVARLFHLKHFVNLF